MSKKLLLTVLYLPLISYAEVADKVPSYDEMWAVSLLIGFAMFFCAYHFKYTIWVAGVISSLLAASLYDMYSDVAFREAVMTEKGSAYFLLGYLLSFLVLLLSVLGGYLRTRKNKRNE